MTARAISLDVSPDMLSIADEAIEEDASLLQCMKSGTGPSVIELSCKLWSLSMHSELWPPFERQIPGFVS